MNKPTLKPYTLPSRSKSPPHDQNLSKSMPLSTLKKMLTKLKEIERMKKAQQLTKAIRNAGKVLNINIVALNKISIKLKVWYFKIPHCA